MKDHAGQTFVTFVIDLRKCERTVVEKAFLTPHSFVMCFTLGISLKSPCVQFIFNVSQAFIHVLPENIRSELGVFAKKAVIATYTINKKVFLSVKYS